MESTAQPPDFVTHPPGAIPAERRRGRGTLTNRTGRFETQERAPEDDGWEGLGALPDFKTEITFENARKIITRNDSPDIGFDRSINPYRGCEHGCVYCFARPSHAYLGLSPGLDFETKLTAKPNAAELLRHELASPSYVARTMAMGTNTDPYQPIERELRITRSVLEVLSNTNHPVSILTKSALVQRDIDILAPMAAKGLAKVALSVTTLDAKLARIMEPRATTPAKRLETLARLQSAGIPTSIMVAPIIPALNDQEIERILDAAHLAGVKGAGYVLLRLPHEIKDLFQEWLAEHRPDRFHRIMNLIRQTHDGKLYDSTWGKRQIGDGVYAWTIGRRFEIAARKFGFNNRRAKLRNDLFTPPDTPGRQLALF